MQSLEEQAHVVQLLRVRRILKKVDSFFVSRRFFFWNVLESQILIGRIVAEQHAIVEGILAAQVVAEHDMRELMREHGCEAGFIGKHVD